MHIIRSIPGVARLRRSILLNEMLGSCHGSHWGAFDSREAALAYLRPRDRAVYDDDRIVHINVAQFQKIDLFDWPVIFHLQKLQGAGELRRVTDFGGHLGVKYVAYRTALDFPDDFEWQVVDVPAVCRAGRLGAGDHAPHLRFHESMEDAQPSDALLCSGSLQYVDRPLDEILARMPERPRSILLNKVSITDGADFHTLEDFGIGRMPHRVMSAASLGVLREACGYKLEREWDIPHRTFEVLARGGTRQVRMIGQAWRDLRTPPKA